MREIKFRAWDADSKPPRMIEGNHIQHLSIVYIERASMPLMQYTGLKDKNGVEVYEGDIFKSENHNPLNFQVEFVEGAWCATSPYVKDYPTEMYHFSLESIEVISNIHENPELLEVESDD